MLKEFDGYSSFGFKAMASDCELLARTNDREVFRKMAHLCLNEIRRFEGKFSRYLEGNLCWELNNSNGEVVQIDEETYLLLEYAKTLYQSSGGLYDVTCGALRKIWKFNALSVVPNSSLVEAMLCNIGFDKINFSEKEFTMPVGMEIDLGGIGKEFCVDKTCQILVREFRKNQVDFLLNLGGDLRAVSLSNNDEYWHVGLEEVSSSQEVSKVIQLKHGAVATSGTTKRFFLNDGKVYSHILNPLTGYPVENGPKSVTVFSENCTTAGSLSTLAHLQGSQAEEFLKECKVDFFCVW